MLIALAVLIVAPHLFAAPVQWTVGEGGNGHSYEYIPGARTWTQARDEAAGRILNGQPGHLVTITSAEENAFVSGAFDASSDQFAWIGGSDSAVEGEWRWVVGPEAGMQFSQVAMATPPFNFANWGPIEPNNFLHVDQGEHWAGINLGGTSNAGTAFGQWGDGPASSSNIPGYIVEYSEPSPVLALSGGPGTTLLSEGFEAWPPTPDHWTLGTVGAGTIAASSEAGAARMGTQALRFDSRNIATRQSAVLKLDLSALAGATDLGLEFWGKRTGSSKGKFELAISGDGTTWTTLHRETPDPEYRQFTVDLDQALADAGIALDADVFLRFAHLALIQDLLLDDIRIVRGIDVVGPEVAGQAPTSLDSTGGPLNQITVIFSEEMDPATFTAEDLTLHDPMGNAIAVTSVAPGPATAGAMFPNTHFNIGFADQNIRGIYRFRLTSAVSDAAGNNLNQDGDLLSGESNDGYSGTVAFESTAFKPAVVAPGGGAGAVLLGEDFEAWPPPGDHWSFGAISGGTIGVSALAPRGGTKELQFNSMDIKNHQWATVKVDLSAFSGATDLGLSFWARQSGSSHGAVCVDLSGDGAVWKEAMRINLAAGYSRFGVDLDAALTRAAIALDGDVYLRLRHLGLIQDLFIDDFQIVRGVDVLGPRVLTQNPTMVGSGAGPLNQIALTFDEAIDPASLTAEDVTLIDPWGGLVPIVSVGEPAVQTSGEAPTVYVISFADQMTRGVYSLRVGPAISDLAGNLMNGDGDINAGESEDAHRGVVIYEATAAALTGGPGTVLLAEDFEAWPPPATRWSFASMAGGMIGVSEVAPHGGLKQLQFNPMSADDPQWAVLKLDLTGVAGATDLAAEFWAKQTGSSHGRVFLDLSGDGAAWTPAIEAEPGAKYARFALDLDQALTDAKIDLDADVFVRLRHKGQTQDLLVDDLRIVRGLDLLGPRIVAQAPLTVSSAGGPLSKITIQFDEAIDPATLTVEDVRVWDPYGVPVTVSQVGGGAQPAGDSPATTYVISFENQDARGVYRFSVGPDVADAAGNLMNQDGDIHAGAASDAYKGTVNYESEAIAVADGMGAIFSEGFEAWPLAGNHWSFSANSGGTISASTNMPNMGVQHLLFDSMNTAQPQYAVLKVDLTAVASAPDLAVVFWAKQMGSTIGRFCADVSGDGTTWKEVFCARSTSSFQTYSFDLDKALRDAGQAADGDVHIRFRHFGLIQDFLLDDVQIMRVGLMPASIVSIKPVEADIELTVSGEFGVMYRVERSTDLANWSTVGSFTGTGGLVTVTDLGAVDMGQFFYRVVINMEP